jgi:hypothetical protein
MNERKITGTRRQDLRTLRLHTTPRAELRATSALRLSPYLGVMLENRRPQMHVELPATRQAAGF